MAACKESFQPCKCVTVRLLFELRRIPKYIAEDSGDKCRGMIDKAERNSNNYKEIKEMTLCGDH